MNIKLSIALPAALSFLVLSFSAYAKGWPYFAIVDETTHMPNVEFRTASIVLTTSYEECKNVLARISEARATATQNKKLTATRNLQSCVVELPAEFVGIDQLKPIRNLYYFRMTNDFGQGPRTMTEVYFGLDASKSQEVCNSIASFWPKAKDGTCVPPLR